jgi:hypothetical protein
LVGAGGRAVSEGLPQSEVDSLRGLASGLVEVVVEVQDRRLQVLVPEQELDLLDVEAVDEPLLGGEAAQTVEGKGAAVFGASPPPSATG